MALKYRLNILGWYNFESLVQVLLKAIIGNGVSSFGGTKDGGRDASFKGTAQYPSADTMWSGKWIFQVKSSELETASGDKEGKRLGAAFKVEITKKGQIRTEWPDNYVLVTNIRLSTKLRESLEEIIRNAGFKGNFSIIDGKEVCEFLDLYPNIRRSFPQLIGIADISLIMDREIRNRSEAYISDWQPKLETFVAVEQYREALEIIDTRSFVVLDGPPEMGKSFIGAAITMSYASNGFQVYYVNNPEQILQVYDHAVKQIYFADDAVGAINYDPDLGDKWGRDLPAIIRKLDLKHKLIWTARSYILKEALDSTKLRENNDKFPAAYEVVVEVHGFTLIEKALILYNHAKTAKLSVAARQLVKDRADLIANSTSFTPERIRRLINTELKDVRGTITKKQKQELSEGILNFLKDPSERFERAYYSLGISEQLLLVSLFDLGSNVLKDDLRKDYEKHILAI